jgi:cpxR
MPKILLVDDDTELSELLANFLTLEGFRVTIAKTDQIAQQLDLSYDLILLDVIAPTWNGIATLKQIRKHYSTPIIILNAPNDAMSRILYLELGADDYLVKPFNAHELIIRIKMLLRRSGQQDNVIESHSATSEQIKFDLLTLHPETQQVFFGSSPIELTHTEFALLLQFIKRPNILITREELSVAILNKLLTPFDRAIDMHMSNLRKKLPSRENGLPWFKTVRGKGYILLKNN